MLFFRNHAQTETVAVPIPVKHVAAASLFDLNGQPVEPHRFPKRRREAHVDVIGDGIDPHANASVNVGLTHIGAEQFCIVAQRPEQIRQERVLRITRSSEIQEFDPIQELQQSGNVTGAASIGY